MKNAMEIIVSAFETAHRTGETLFIAFTYGMRFEIFSSDYGLKLKLMHALEACKSITYEEVMAAKKMFEAGKAFGKVSYHCAEDTDISVDREEVWMFHNFS